MLNSREKKFSFLFVIIVVIELFTELTTTLNYTHYVVKPAIVSSLIALVISHRNTLTSVAKTHILLALGFSLLGDILLMFVEQFDSFFTLGLIAFLLAHVMYSLLFLKHRNTKVKAASCIAILILYASVVFYLLKDGLGAMLIPVSLYMIVILFMVLTAFLRKDKVEALSYKLVLSGAVFFIISDSLLALNKFYLPIPAAGIYIMLSYALAQYFIVLGILKTKL
jgi:uncharacterized membrane protein YhhN